MRVRCSKICALTLALAMVPGAAEIVESAVHIMTEGHLAHAAPEGDHHEPAGPEHGCTPTFHLCGCHTSLSFLRPQVAPRVTLHASLNREASKSVAPPSGFLPSIDHPPRA
jgi:hypothetical protein